MSLASYADLETAVNNWTKRADLASSTPDFITLAEARLQREIRSRDMELRFSTTLSSTSDYLTLPTDFLSIRSVFLSSGGVLRPLTYVTPDALILSYPNDSSTSEPSWYTIVGAEMRFGPFTDSAYTTEIWYYKRLAALSSSVPTLFTNNPDLYLSATLSEAFKFMKDEDRAEYWEGKYQAIKKQVNDTEEAGRRAVGMQMVAA